MMDIRRKWKRDQKVVTKNKINERKDNKSARHREGDKKTEGKR